MAVELTTMYSAKNNSPITTLTVELNSSDTVMTVADASVLPAAPNLAVLGNAENAEIVRYTAISENSVTIVRGVHNTTAGTWAIGTTVARNFTAYDHDAFKGNIEALNTGKSDSSHTHDDRYYTETEVDTTLLGKVNNASITQVFDPERNYSNGDMVMYQGTLYKFYTAHTGAWTGSDANAVTVLSQSGGGTTVGYGDEITFNDTSHTMIISSSGHTVEELQSAIAIISEGDSHIAIPEGQFVYVKLHSTLGEGLYRAKSAIGANVALTTTNLASVSGGGLNKLMVLKVDCGTVSSLPATVSNSEVTSDMVVLQSTFGTPSAATSNWTVSTSEGQLTISGSISGSTTLTLYLMKSRS